MQVPLVVACIGPFVTPPRLQLGYILGGAQLATTLALPIVLSKFCTPPDAPVPREVFFTRWRTLQGSLMKPHDTVVDHEPFSDSNLSTYQMLPQCVPPCFATELWHALHGQEGKEARA